MRTVTSLLCVCATLFLLWGCSESSGKSSSRETAAPTRERGPRVTTTEIGDTAPNHPSADCDGMIYYYGNNQGRMSNRTVTSQILLYTDAYEQQASAKITEKKIDLHRRISRDEMGAIVDQMDTWGYYQWPSSKDYSAMGPVAQKSVGQITATTSRGTHTTSWTSDDTAAMTTAADRNRAEKFANLRMVLLQFCQSSDYEVKTQVQGR